MRMITLDEADIKTLCHKARSIFMSQPMLLELEAPIKICGEKKWIRKTPQRGLIFLS
nr:unnamed protein product [Callosobruchus analis]